jgi:hypothetical protein
VLVPSCTSSLVESCRLLSASVERLFFPRQKRDAQFDACRAVTVRNRPILQTACTDRKRNKSLLCSDFLSRYRARRTSGSAPAFGQARIHVRAHGVVQIACGQVPVAEAIAISAAQARCRAHRAGLDARWSRPCLARMRLMCIVMHTRCRNLPRRSCARRPCTCRVVMRCGWKVVVCIHAHRIQ